MKDASKPIGWPANIPLPTEQEAEKAVLSGEKIIVEMTDELKGKLEGTSPEMFNTQITI